MYKTESGSVCHGNLQREDEGIWVLEGVFSPRCPSREMLEALINKKSRKAVPEPQCICKGMSSSLKVGNLLPKLLMGSLGYFMFVGVYFNFILYFFFLTVNQNFE